LDGVRALITGIAGFAGRHLAELCLQQGATVIGTGLRAEEDADLLPPDSEYLRCDLLDAARTRECVRAAKPELVFHLAAEAAVGRSWQDPGGTITRNVEMTVNVMDAIREEAPSARVLVACSGEEYGAPERLPVDERAELRPQNPYAVSKAAVDLLAGQYRDAHGLHMVRTRAFNHAGPGQSDDYVVSAFARQIAEAEATGRDSVEIVTGNLEPRRDFTDVRDVVRGYWLALERADPDVYNVGSGVATPVADILAALADQSLLEVRQRTDPGKLRPHEVMEIRASHDKLTDATGWQPQVPLERTLRDTLHWWRERVTARVTS
jgi:GDP-4-dehydro-6-deoxy-D-mannose reductase